MPTQVGSRDGLTVGDVIKYIEDLEKEYAVKIRTSLVPLAKHSGKATRAVLVTVYTKSGRKDVDIPHEQAIFPGGTAKTREGCEVYLLTRIATSLEERAQRQAVSNEGIDPNVLTPLEQYIMGRS